MLTIGLPGFLAFGFYLALWGLFIRVIAGHNRDNRLGQALAAIY
jgi:hypothetical protein